MGKVRIAQLFSLICAMVMILISAALLAKARRACVPVVSAVQVTESKQCGEQDPIDKQLYVLCYTPDGRVFALWPDGRFVEVVPKRRVVLDESDT